MSRHLHRAREHEHDMLSNLRMRDDVLRPRTPSSAAWTSADRFLAAAAYHAAIATALRNMHVEDGVEP